MRRHTSEFGEGERAYVIQGWREDILQNSEEGQRMYGDEREKTRARIQGGRKGRQSDLFRDEDISHLSEKREPTLSHGSHDHGEQGSYLSSSLSWLESMYACSCAICCASNSILGTSALCVPDFSKWRIASAVLPDASSCFAYV